MNKGHDKGHDKGHKGQMSDREAMKLALKAFEVATTPLAADRQEVLKAQQALRQALEQPDDEWSRDKDKILAVIRQKGLTLLRTSSGYDLVRLGQVTAQSLAQPEQEPVAWMYEDELPESYPYDLMYPYSKVDGVRLFPVYTAPPKRNWVGLTDEEIQKVVHDMGTIGDLSHDEFDICRAVIAKLKEKNS